MYALYAFCREVDSVVDEPAPGSNPEMHLAFWRAELDALYSSSLTKLPPRSPVVACLAEHIRRFTLPQAYFEDIIDGVKMDLTIDRYRTFEDLSIYCYRVASAVGLICLKIFGARDAKSETYAVNLGLAFQLTNILRDVKSDAGRGRIYLPQEDLERFQVREDEILQGVYSDRFSELMAFECRRADDYYRGAKEALTETDRDALLPAEIMRAIYQSILERIKTSGYQVFKDRIGLSPSRRLALAIKVWLSGGNDGMRGTG
jgi:phytoene synthase